MDNTNNPELIVASPPSSQHNIGKSKIFLFLAFVVILVAAITGAYILGTKNQSFPQPTPVPIVSTTPTPTPNPTTTWKTYSNNTYNFSLSYPTSWKLEETTNINAKIGFSLQLPINNAILFENKEYPSKINSESLKRWIEFGQLREDYDGRVYGAIYFTTENTNPESFYKLNSHQNEDKSCGPHEVQDSDQLLTLGSLKAIKSATHAACDYEGAHEKTLRVQYKLLLDNRENYNVANIYVIYDSSHPTINTELKILDQILSTFKSLNSSQPAETANWQTYTNTELSYSFTYPISWTNCPNNFGGGQTDTAIYLCSASFQPFDYIWTSFVNNPQNINFQQIVTQNFDEALKSNFKYTTTTIGQNSAFVTRSLPGATTSESVFFKTPNNGYVGISYQPINADLGFSETYSSYKIFRQILSTFKFLD